MSLRLAISLPALLVLGACSFGSSSPTPTPSAALPSPTSVWASPSPEPSSGSGALVDKGGSRTYRNAAYRFTLTVPERMHSPCDDSTADVTVEDTATGVRIGNRFACSKRPWTGWTLHANNGARTTEDIDAFVRQVAGADCRLVGWDEGEPRIVAATEDGNKGTCSFATTRYRMFYSERYHTFVLWSLTRDPQFLSAEDPGASWDEDMVASFAFAP